MAQRPRRVTAALWLAGIGALCALLAVLLYEKPKSFYTNFVILPTIYLLATALLFDLVAIILAFTGLRSEGRRPALVALGIAVFSPMLAMAAIQLIIYLSS